MKTALNCRTIPAGKVFVNELAAYILAEYGHDATSLTQALVLLPNRRACRALREAFLTITGGKPTLLPRIQPLGDMDEESTAAFRPEADSPATIDPVRRLLLLAKLVRGQHNYSMEQSLHLARQLASFMDDVEREGLGWDGLAQLVPADLTKHWQQTVEFLSIVTRHWPGILQAEEVMEPVAYRNRLLTATAGIWKQHPPHYPVIAAGSTGSIPAAATLLSVIAALPQGLVVLPALDTHMEDSEWDDIAHTHPQYGMKQLLSQLGCTRGDVPTLREDGQGENARTACLRAILHPPEATAHWLSATLPLAEGLSGMHLITADTLHDEARQIAVILRETLETPEKTAALVTPDRQLARMVATQLERFGIVIDDSAGHPLRDTATACFLRLLAEMVASEAAPAALLALLRHPFSACGMPPQDCRRLSRRLEVQLLRGVRHAPGLEALRAAAQDDPALEAFLAQLIGAVQPLADCFNAPDLPLRTLLEAHIHCAERLAATPETPGAQILWQGEAGNAMAAFLASLLPQSELLEEVHTSSYPGVFDTLLTGEVFRPNAGLHPRLHILGPLEARLLRYDRIVLGSLNEGMWPSAAQADPWMSRPMRESFGLPAAERAVGQSAHDLYLLCAAPEVFLTRARKADGTPTVPSRWLVRLETLVRGQDAALYHSLRNHDYAQAVTVLDAPLAMDKAERPAPRPPLDARPRQMRVTAIDAWLRDPYEIYARSILRLRALKPLDEEPGAADLGQLVHDGLDRFVRAFPDTLPPDPLRELLACGREAFAPYIDRPAVACLWWPRFETMAAWFIEREGERRVLVRQVLGEQKGEWHFHVDGKPFALTTRIDRIDINRDGTLTIGDYKTGTPPSKKDVEEGYANQLPLEALMLAEGQWQSPALPHPRRIGQLEYWRLAGTPEQCELTVIGNAEPLAANARALLESLIRKFDNATTAYAPPENPALAGRFSDFKHLTRRAEWQDA